MKLASLKLFCYNFFTRSMQIKCINRCANDEQSNKIQKVIFF